MLLVLASLAALLTSTAGARLGQACSSHADCAEVSLVSVVVMMIVMSLCSGLPRCWLPPGAAALHVRARPEAGRGRGELRGEGGHAAGQGGHRAGAAGAGGAGGGQARHAHGQVTAVYCCVQSILICCPRPRHIPAQQTFQKLMVAAAVEQVGVFSVSDVILYNVRW